MLIKIVEFLSTGDFGPVKIGMHRNDVIDLLGTPDDEAEFGAGSGEIIYSLYELFFNPDQTIRAIQIDNYDPDCPESYEFKSSRFEVDPWFMRATTRPIYSEISVLFIDAGIEFTTVEYFDRLVIKLASGVVIDFDDEVQKLEDRPFIGIRYFPEFDT